MLRPRELLVCPHAASPPCCVPYSGQVPVCPRGAVISCVSPGVWVVSPGGMRRPDLLCVPGVSFRGWTMSRRQDDVKASRRFDA